MSVRRQRGRLRVVSTPQTTGDGRASRAQDGRGLPHRPTLPGEAGAVASLVLALADPRLHSPDVPEPDRQRALYLVSHARRRVRKQCGPEAFPVILAAAQAQRADLAALATAHEDARPRLVAAAVEAVEAAREHGVQSTLALASLAAAKRMTALGQTLLDRGARTLDPDIIRAGADLVGRARLELLHALDLERRSAVTREDPAIATAREQAWARLEEHRRQREADAAEARPEDEGASDTDRKETESNVR